MQFWLEQSNQKDETIKEKIIKVFSYLEEKGHTPKFNVMDNQALHVMKEYLQTKEGVKWQFVQPRNHRVNAAERAIQTFKNYFIAGLCTLDPDFPIQLWDHLLMQAQDSLNMLHVSRCNPIKVAY